MAKIKGWVVLEKKVELALSGARSTNHDSADELLGERVLFRLVSATQADPDNGNRGTLSEPSFLEDRMTELPDNADTGDCAFEISFELDEEFGLPGAVIVENLHHKEFFLKSLTLGDVPGTGRVHFDCHSWVFPREKYASERVFFTNQSCLPNETPPTLRMLREAELVTLRGNGCGKLEMWERVYDYDVYNDLGDPDRDQELIRPLLGGSKQYPYPRRGRTGRPPSEADPRSESRLSMFDLDIYIPCDERFKYIKMSHFMVYATNVIQLLIPELRAPDDRINSEFASFQDVLNLYGEGFRLPDFPPPEALKHLLPLELIQLVTETNGERVMKFPEPQVIQDNKSAWKTDEEFAREMLAGVNPVVICCLQALKNKRLFILDYHDKFMPYLNRINSTSSKAYASRTLLFLKDDGTLAPLAIELSLPHPQGQEYGAVSKVFTPAYHGIAASVWQLAKAYVAVNDSGYHQLVSHWLNTHATIEPFVIATHRQLSVLHPIYKLLHPHLRDTMNINALARHTLINAGSVLERTVFPGKYAMEMSSLHYRDWTFTEQNLPADLLKRNGYFKSKKPHNLHLVIEDYPYAVDGLEIWSAIQEWVRQYCTIYYKSDQSIKSDPELQAWWREIRNVGHEDKKDEPWWPKMETIDDLIEILTIVIWIASALHAALNYGQYPYAGYLPNKPTMSRRFMPEPGTEEYLELESNDESAILKSITHRIPTMLGMSLIEILSRHFSDELYLGQTASAEWTGDEAALAAFHRFGEKLEEIEKKIVGMNSDESKWKNRMGPVRVPYTLLYPGVSDLSRIGGLTVKGIPNSVSM